MQTFMWRSSQTARIICIAALLLTAHSANGRTDRDWVGFQGSRVGRGINDKLPTEWDDTKNIHWKFALPGPGASSPVIVDNKVFITCFAGYGVDPTKPGNLEKLVRYLYCIDRTSGKKIWRAKINIGSKEDALTRQISDHGYASSTPASDGKYIYTFFGKAGVSAFDMDGERVWHFGVGDKSSRFTQGSGASPILFRDMLIINAADESRAIIALNKFNGKELWRAESEELDGSYVTPVITPASDGSHELVVTMINRAWGLDPETGGQKWNMKIRQGGSIVPTAIATDEAIFLFGGMGGTTYALKPGGKGDLTKDDIIWTSRNGSIVPSPLLHKGHLYWADMQGIAYCIKANDGTQVYKKKLGKRAGCYSSPVLANGKIFYVTRTAGTYVIAAEPEYSMIVHNTFKSDESRFDGTPAIVDGMIYMRSNKALYCIGK